MLADDATSAGKIKDLKEWWDIIPKEGEIIGYYVNTSKSWIIIKDVTKLGDAKEQFGNSIKFTTDGKRHLGAIIGSQSFKDEYVNEKVEKWCQEIERLIKIEETQPHAAYAAYIHGLQHKYTYFKRTIPNLDDYLHRLDELITERLIPTAGADADRVHWLGEPSQIFIATTLFLVLRLIITYCCF